MQKVLTLVFILKIILSVTHFFQEPQKVSVFNRNTRMSMCDSAT
jgi:hypothetical protein